MNERIDALARKIEHDADFLASALAAYARAENLCDEDLALRLGCTSEQLGPIRLCRTPRPTPLQFQHDVDRIATAFQIQSDVIAEAVRLADALAALAHLNGGAGYLMAARDRDHSDVNDDTEEEP